MEQLQSGEEAVALPCGEHRSASRDTSDLGTTCQKLAIRRIKSVMMIRRAPMKFRMIASALAVILLAGGLASAGDSPDKKREKTRKMADQTLQERTIRR
jgi:hypothetical protein